MEIENTWFCKFCGEVDYVRRESWQEKTYCCDCGMPVEKAYICPGCSKLKLEPEMMIDEFWLCKECFKEELASMMKERNNPRRIQIIDFLKECS